ncbi:MAG: L-histidine N(alpha)-methyltransferase [Acetobacteraceae bacterium]|nr:L-histidine N(alpha)-methyltransferase [Acetobacteraceae bacterium]
MPEGTRLFARGRHPADFRPDVATEALEGLTKPRKTLPAKLFYDDEGCRLFGRITALPEYYPTRTETAMLRDLGPDVGRVVPDGAVVVEYGAGDETKAALLLAALAAPSAYVPIDIAEGALSAAADRLRALMPTLGVFPLALDFLKPFSLPIAVRGRRLLGYFSGSTIGNLEPASAVQFMRHALATLGPGSQFLIGVDMRKSPIVLIPAYNDGRGVTAAFNRNLLVRLNREAAADFDVDAFEHAAIWNDAESRIEMHLISRRDQVASVAGRRIQFNAGETIHTENSYKHTIDGFRAMAASAGWRPAKVWTDPDDLFSLHLLDTGA